jgi:hypothetical protein
LNRQLKTRRDLAPSFVVARRSPHLDLREYGVFTLREFGASSNILFDGCISGPAVFHLSDGRNLDGAIIRAIGFSRRGAIKIPLATPSGVTAILP